MRAPSKEIDKTPYRVLSASHFVLLERLFSLEFHAAEFARFNLDMLQFVPEMV